jgi:hypothetical protein
MSDDPKPIENALAREAVNGDLRPQFNPASLLSRNLRDLKSVEPVLLERFFHLSRPIANAATSPTSDMRLRDSAHFFYLIETLRRSGCAHLYETLLVILDEFLQLDEHSYNELYLWSIVELSRHDPGNVEKFWPAVIALDQRYRSEPLIRVTGMAPVDQPYRMCELLFFYYVILSLHTLPGYPRAPTLGTCLLLIREQLTREQIKAVGETLRSLAEEQGRKAYSDAYGMLMNMPQDHAYHELIRQRFMPLQPRRQS